MQNPEQTHLCESFGLVHDNTAHFFLHVLKEET